MLFHSATMPIFETLSHAPVPDRRNVKPSKPTIAPLSMDVPADVQTHEDGEPLFPLMVTKPVSDAPDPVKDGVSVNPQSDWICGKPLANSGGLIWVFRTSNACWSVAHAPAPVPRQSDAVSEPEE